MITKYKACCYWTPEIKVVQIVRQTESFVILPKRPSIFNGHKTEQREAINSSDGCYFDTWEDAHQFLMAKAKDRVLGARRELEVAQGKLGNVKGMKGP